jgi:hypothetical protein
MNKLMITRVLAIFVVIASIVSVQAAPKLIVTFDSVGSVRIGMTARAVEQALGARLDAINELVYSDECWVTQRSDGVDAGIQYTFQHGRLSRVDIFQPKGAKALQATTGEGIGIGSAEADIKKIYGNKIVITRDPNDSEEAEIAAAKERKLRGDDTPDGPPEFWVRLDSADHGRGIIFKTKGGRVTSLRTGLRKAIEDMEICI